MKIKGEIVLKWKKCSKCGSIQPNQKGRIFECRECGYTCVDGFNIWLLTDKYSNKRDVERIKRESKIFEVDDLSSSLLHLKKAIENWEKGE